MPSTIQPLYRFSRFYRRQRISRHGQNQGVDICDIIYGILSGRITTSSYTSTGSVIETRGLSGTALTCTKGSPWSESGVYVTQPSPSTILLPAGTIKIPTLWILPNGTKLIGEGTSNPALNLSNNQLQTTILALDALSSGPMIQFGDSNCPGSPTPTCTGISIESLTLGRKQSHADRHREPEFKTRGPVPGFVSCAESAP